MFDLKLPHKRNFFNFHTQKYKRAISRNHFEVTKVGLIYSKTLEEFGVFPTLKHFPGLGRVSEDTHHFAGELNENLGVLMRNNWRPFREITEQTHAFMMMGHVKVNKVDKKNLASFSPMLIKEIIRKYWNNDVVLITDDLNMGAVANKPLGIEKVTVKALDLLLVSYDGQQYYKAIYALIQAENNHKLDLRALVESDIRLLKAEIELSKKQRPIFNRKNFEQTSIGIH